MQSIFATTTLNSFLSKPPEFSNMKIRESFERLERRSPPLLFKSPATYKACKQPILGFNDSLYFVHKLWRTESRPSPSQSPVPKPRPGFSLSHSKRQTIGKYKIVVRSNTPSVNTVEPSPAKTQAELPLVSIKRKVCVAKFEKRTPFRSLQKYKDQSTEALNGWSEERTDYY
jgi:hypothetical protein